MKGPQDMAIIQCDQCQGNGEIVTDWETYLHPPNGAEPDAGTKDCPNCQGIGWFDDADETPSS